MNKQEQPRKPGMARCLAVVLLSMAAAGAAQAQIRPDSRSGLGLSLGIGDHYKRAMLSYETPSLWSYSFSENWGRLDLVGELGVGYWSADGSRDPSHMWQFSATPMFRWWTGERFYLEAGIGANLFSSTRFADKTISTAFQFGDHIGLGFLVTPTSRLGLRYSHFSNASIKRPNPGLNILQLNYTYQF